MQSKGAIRIVAIALALASLWALSFTGVALHLENKAQKHADAQVELAKQQESFKQIPENEQQPYLDEIEKTSYRAYLDSLSSEKVYFAYTYKDVKSRELNLGLDLKGGMNVMLQVQLEDLVKALSDDNQTEPFQQALQLAKANSVNSTKDYITLFAEAWTETSGGQPLATVFGTVDLADKVKATSTDEEVIGVLRSESESAIANSFNVLRNRIDRFGVASPNIQKIGNSGRILIELPGVKEPERVRKLLQGTASLEFWRTYDYQEIEQYLLEADAVLADVLSAEDSITVQNPLFSVLHLAGGKTALIGFANYADTAKINTYLNMPKVKAVLPPELRPMWTVKPSSLVPDGNTFELVAIKDVSHHGKAPLDGDVVTDARVQYGNMQGGHPEVSMTMNAQGATIWANLTKENIGKQIAIVLDDMVYSYPTVNTEISGGSSQITGNFDLEEAEDLANVLKSGKLPAPATIVQEQVVGPSLGAESINAGLISFVIAFVLVLLYMIFFYNGAGLVANVALLCNVLLLLGTLVSFHAVLTLPGIAGLVLTMGMAVDANVIIFERIKEELRSGKGLARAISEGYSNAYSAIIDGQLTTIITGVVLYIFGSGPIQGFATTLIIGIITSLLTSIFISRLIFEDRLAKGKNITFDNKLTRNFLQNTRINFLDLRKITYIVSGVLIIASFVSIFTKGFTYGVDFTGGRTYIVRFDQDVTAEDIRAAALEEFDGAVEVKQFGGESQMKITTQYLSDNETTEADAVVEEKLYVALQGFFADPLTLEEFTSTLTNPYGIQSSDKVGPTIASDIRRDATIAVLIALLAIFAYIAVRFKGWPWGFGGVMGLAHTSIILIGFFSFFSGILPFSLDVDQTFIAAVLTVIGYAINDTVVIFDRIREHLGLNPKADFKATVNGALNSTLSRTINTSFTTLIVIVTIAIFGGEVIRGLAVALIIGIVVGTYSSLFVATPLMYDVTVRRKNKKRKA